MKNLMMLLFSLSFIVAVSAQQRVVVLEEYTSAT
jgi:hypothetical protein